MSKERFDGNGYSLKTFINKSIKYIFLFTIQNYFRCRRKKRSEICSKCQSFKYSIQLDKFWYWHRINAIEKDQLKIYNNKKILHTESTGFCTSFPHAGPRMTSSILAPIWAQLVEIGASGGTDSRSSSWQSPESRMGDGRNFDGCGSESVHRLSRNDFDRFPSFAACGNDLVFSKQKPIPNIIFGPQFEEE